MVKYNEETKLVEITDEMPAEWRKDQTLLRALVAKKAEFADAVGFLVGGERLNIAKRGENLIVRAARSANARKDDAANVATANKRTLNALQAALSEPEKLRETLLARRAPLQAQIDEIMGELNTIDKLLAVLGASASSQVVSHAEAAAE